MFRMFVYDHRGLASLPTVIALSVLILVLGVGVASISFSENLVALKFSQSPRALFYAESGARDALERISRNKNFSSPAGYQVEFVQNGCSNREGCAIITVTTTSSPKVIVSTGKYRSANRKVEVDVTFDAGGNGEIQTTTWQEITN